MKTFYLIRHAEATSIKANEMDNQRPLNQSGKNETYLIGRNLKKQDIQLDYIICSSAKRTKQTASLLCDQLNYPIHNIQFDNKIYEASLADLIEIINHLPNEYKKVALIGHNPSITYLANYFTDNNFNYIPTCGVVKIELEINSWKELTRGIGYQKFYIYPKMF